MERDHPAETAADTATISWLTGHVAHELNNLLGAIRGNSELMAEFPGDSSMVRACAQDILIACDRLSELSWRLQATGGRLGLKVAATSLAQWASLLQTTLQDAAGPQIHVQVLHSGGPLLYTDADHLSRAVRQLVEDAAQRLPTTIDVSVRIKDDMTHIRLSDNRQGAAALTPPNDDLRFRAMNAVVQGLGGEVQHRRETHGAYVSHIQLPNTAPSRSRAPSTDSGENLRVLVVDDDPQMGKMVERVLRRAGFQPTLYRDPAAALDFVQGAPHEFDIALLDIAMPGMTGPDLLQTLRHFGIDLPVVFMTGALPPGSTVAGARYVLNKPFGRNELIEALLAHRK